jgi:hypothetical protein
MPKWDRMRTTRCISSAVIKVEGADLMPSM